jgi:hypothetical protein
MRKPEFVCVKTMFIGYIAFYKGKTYVPSESYANGHYFVDEYSETHQLNNGQIKEFFELINKPVEKIDFDII